MSSIDPLSDLASALEAFFKGLLECGLVSTYSVQLQVATVDFVVQIKFHCLVYQFVKTLQALLMKLNIPGHENSHDIGVQTPTDFSSVFMEAKNNEVKVPADQLESLVEECVFSKTENNINWTDPDNSECFKADQASFVVQNDCHCASTNIIVTCHPAALPAIPEHNIVASDEHNIHETDAKKLELPCDSVDNFRSKTTDDEHIITEGSSGANHISECEKSSTELDTCQGHFIEIDSTESLENDSEETNQEEVKTLESDINPLILETFVEEQSVINDNMSVMHIVVASDNSEDKCIAIHKLEKDKKKPFKCKVCDKSFLSSQSLEIHLNRKHAAKEQCDMCPKTFSSIQSLQEHCRIDHGGMGCFNCHICSRRFMTKLSYKRHMDTHVGKKEAVCDMCGKTFSRADYLNKHYMTHSGTRPLSCSQCPRKFISSSHLKNHEKTHTGEREHLCKLCPKSFSRADKLKEHTLRHLNIKRFQCSICKRTYAEKRDLTKHMRAHEK